MLAENGTPPESVNVKATVTLRPVDGTPTIANVKLVAIGRVSGIDEGGVKEYAGKAKAGCPVSRVLAAFQEVIPEASLAH
jgi:osmotically inducible protein OsmC